MEVCFCPIDDALMVCLPNSTSFILYRTNEAIIHRYHHHTITSTALPMGLFDFLTQRQGDFIPLTNDDDTPYGPGPLIIMYAVPNSMDDAELRDMVNDGMPNTRGVVIRRIDGVGEEETNKDTLLDLSVRNALELVMKEGSKTQPRNEFDTTLSMSQQQQQLYSENDPCPVLYFSGMTNKAMMDTYRIIADEIYKETNGVHWPACAKVVEPAMTKSLRRVIMEISGDHADAMKMRRDAARDDVNG
jgi:hypothetical protein